MFLKRRVLISFLSLLTASNLALAQAFPTKPIRLIVPFPPASNPDILARLVGELVAVRLKQPVIVENRPGAGGMIGSDAVAKAAADGYTLLVGDSGPLSIGPWVYAKMPYAPAKDFVGVASLVVVPLVMIVPKTSKVNTPTDLVAQAKANPGQLLYGTVGVGSIHHLTIELLSAAAGIKLTHVPYKGNAELAAAIANGDIQMAFSGIPSVGGFIKDGRIRAIAVTTSRRSAALPDVRTLQEQGFRDFEVASSIGIAAPLGVPADRLKVLEEAFLATMKEQKLLDRIDGLGMLARPAVGAAYHKVITNELDRFGRVVKAAGIEPQ